MNSKFALRRWRGCDWRSKNTRARLLLFFLALAMLSGGAPLGATAPRHRILKTNTITPDGGRYYHGWPTVARLRNGRLIVAWSGGRDAHVCPFGRVESMVSLDEGESWSWPRVLLDSPLDDRDAGVMETLRGTLLLTTFGSVSYRLEGRRERYAQQPEKWARFERGGDITAAVATAAGPQLLRSEDGGLSWSAPQRMPVNSPHGPIQLTDGRLLYPGISSVGMGRLYKPDERKMGVWESIDDGRAWKLLAEIPARPGESLIDYHELHGAEAANGTMVVLIRSHANGAKREMLQTESRDGGATWGVPRSIGIRGYPPHLMRLRDGRLLLSYDHRQPPFGVQVRISVDHGATWSEPLVITANPEKLDQGYPSTAQLADGSFLTVWYEVSLGKKKAVLKQAKWVVDATP